MSSETSFSGAPLWSPAVVYDRCWAYLNHAVTDGQSQFTTNETFDDPHALLCAVSARIAYTARQNMAMSTDSPHLKDRLAGDLAFMVPQDTYPQIKAEAFCLGALYGSDQAFTRLSEYIEQERQVSAAMVVQSRRRFPGVHPRLNTPAIEKVVDIFADHDMDPEHWIGKSVVKGPVGEEQRWRFMNRYHLKRLDRNPKDAKAHQRYSRHIWQLLENQYGSHFIAQEIAGVLQEAKADRLFVEQLLTPFMEVVPKVRETSEDHAFWPLLKVGNVALAKNFDSKEIRTFLDQNIEASFEAAGAAVNDKHTSHLIGWRLHRMARAGRQPSALLAAAQAASTSVYKGINEVSIICDEALALQVQRYAALGHFTAAACLIEGIKDESSQFASALTALGTVKPGQDITPLKRVLHSSDQVAAEELYKASKCVSKGDIEGLEDLSLDMAPLLGGQDLEASAGALEVIELSNNHIATVDKNRALHCVRRTLKTARQNGVPYYMTTFLSTRLIEAGDQQEPAAAHKAMGALGRPHNTFDPQRVRHALAIVNAIEKAQQ